MSNSPRNRARPVSVAAIAGLALLGAACVKQDRSEGLTDDAGSPAAAMTAERLGELILSVDEDARREDTTWLFVVAGLETAVVYDVAADRMRIVIPIGPADDIPKDELVRILQANYDSALDARYAIANGQLWGTYIHPLSELSEDQFLTGLGQTANVVLSYGTSYSSECSFSAAATVRRYSAGSSSTNCGKSAREDRPPGCGVRVIRPGWAPGRAGESERKAVRFQFDIDRVVIDLDRLRERAEAVVTGLPRKVAVELPSSHDAECGAVGVHIEAVEILGERCGVDAAAYVEPVFGVNRQRRVGLE